MMEMPRVVQMGDKKAAIAMHVKVGGQVVRAVTGNRFKLTISDSRFSYKAYLLNRKEIVFWTMLSNKDHCEYCVLWCHVSLRFVTTVFAVVDDLNRRSASAPEWSPLLQISPELLER